MILIDSILVDPKILTQPFSCDVQECKGACCTLEGGEGAPLKKEEIPLLESSIKVASEYLSTTSKEAIQKHGSWEEVNGKYYTKTIDEKDCVFVFYQNGIAKCSIEKSYFEGKTEFRKPISCHLFPIRKVNFGGDYIYYEHFDECKPANAAGLRTNNTVLTNSKDALIRMYGIKWYENALQYAFSQNKKDAQ